MGDVHDTRLTAADQVGTRGVKAHVAQQGQDCGAAVRAAGVGQRARRAADLGRDGQN